MTVSSCRFVRCVRDASQTKPLNEVLKSSSGAHSSPFPTGSRPVAHIHEGPRPRRRKPLQFAGMPLGLWLVLIGGVVLAGVLAAMLFLRNRS